MAYLEVNDRFETIILTKVTSEGRIKSGRLYQSD